MELALDMNVMGTLNSLIENRDTIKAELANYTSDIIRLSIENHAETRASILGALVETRSLERDLLRGLQFATMEHRHSEIPEAHRQTFRWIFDEFANQTRPWSNFVEWSEKEADYIGSMGRREAESPH
jgi:hypothetical protein